MQPRQLAPSSGEPQDAQYAPVAIALQIGHSMVP